MPLVIDAVSPTQGRPGDVLRITGSGMPSDATLLACIINSAPAQVLYASPVVTEVLVPDGIASNRQVTLQLTDLSTSGNFASTHWMSRRPLAELPAAVLSWQEPAVLEDILREVPGRPEAKDYERLVARVSSLAQELLGGVGGAGRVGVDPSVLAALGSPTTLAGALQEAALLSMQRSDLDALLSGFYGIS